MSEERLVTQITPKSEDFSRWYVDLIRRAELADYAPMKGMMVIRPYGYAIWENIQRLLDKRIKDTGHINAYFPLFIPESFLRKEMEHLKGFAPEVAWVTHGGDDELEERLAVRPTSEAIIGYMYSKWIKSWRDLPVLINQWANVVRWEKVTRPFLRTTEFLWQEGHTAHASFEEAQAETLLILEMYREFVETELAIPVIYGQKTEREKFAGALATYAIEALMSDGKALQMGTSHNLGQHFARVFNIRFEDNNQDLQYAWQTSWGVSTRLIGALVMAHGDDSGLVFPPQVAPIQVVIVPISVGNWRETVLPVATEIKNNLKNAGLRVFLDDRAEYTPGWKFSEWEMRGVPLRLEIGPRDVKNNQVVACRRENQVKITLEITGLETKVKELLAEIQRAIFDKALSFQKENTYEVEDYKEFKSILEEKRGFIKAFWCGSEECEAKIKEETMATIRVIPHPQGEQKKGRCLYCQKPASIAAVFARSY
ncbi:MAG TPA: proline--tRNA ligase [Candidatus Aminicenantes bacterium]|nr:MAG: proline--tRNA ligase [Candidatus Aminicenantes bacterium]HEK85942.1 proline--tRNA ligase [Candidatus Aminicenantes bacterium]